MLDKPIVSKTSDAGEGNNLKYAVASMQGWRCEMEDKHTARTGLDDKEFADWSFFAVFDGHAGDQSAIYSSSHLLEAILATDEFKKRDVPQGIRTGFLNMDTELRQEFCVDINNSGTTAVGAFISPDSVYLANCGDSRAIFCRNGSPVVCTEDHKPTLPGERERILNAGGSVIIQRVNGSLAVSRALGDFEYKNVEGKGQCEQLVSPEPEVLKVERNPADEFLVLACDGVWDVMSNEEVCSYVTSRLKVESDLQKVVCSVIDTCFHKVGVDAKMLYLIFFLLLKPTLFRPLQGSRDNMSVIIVTFPGAPLPTPEAVSAESALSLKITEIVRGCYCYQSCFVRV